MSAPTTAPPFTHRQIVLIFCGLGLGMLLASLDQTIVSTALPTITGDLGGLRGLSWVVTAYLVTTTISTPLYGKLGDILGRKRLFQAAIVIFLAGSVLCGLATSMAQLIAFRGLQGMGGGGLMVLAMAIVADVVSPRERGRYMGYFGAMFTLASVVGPLVGGFLTDNLSWRWVFYVNVPLGIVAFLVTASVLPGAERRQKRKIDYMGAGLLAVAVSILVLLTTWGGAQYPWGSPTIVLLALADLVVLALLLFVEMRAEEPVVPLHLFRNRAFALSVSMTFVFGMALMSSLTFLPLFLQIANGASATTSGLSMLPLMGGLVAATTGSGRLITRTGRYKAYPIVGTGLASAVLFLLSAVDAHTSRVIVSAYMFALGIGLGLTVQVMVLVAQNAVHQRDLGAATGTVTFFRSIGMSIGVALFGALFNSALAKSLQGIPGVVLKKSLQPATIRSLPPATRGLVVDAFAHSIAHTFLYTALVMAVGFAMTWRLKETPLRGSATADEVVRDSVPAMRSL